ncbi:TetR/AcrR family transcriptional regulator [Frondihabitans australicus]|uniref:TetR family transcriptional regulator n=1 Tax=Frondihabitans australicus TaxID=386892 RepID=A0A495IHN2_9MICO|nr:TetR/AcrR family transcriptional regulator [Frondihabitans australicus]RKR74606.1 TetR family transcriptional regulator [Frondihabitans australicus]
MTSTPAGRSGRPRRSSAEILADAASELFLENGYAGTTVDQIAQRAGVSRATFFNYFAGKADLLWLDLDASLARLPEALRSPAVRELPVVASVQAALVDVARAHDDERVPWALTQAEAMRLGDDLVASGAARFVAQHQLVAAYVAQRRGERPDDVWPQVVSSTLLAAAGAAVVSWARAGIGRGPLVASVEPAVAPVARGLAAALGE